MSTVTSSANPYTILNLRKGVSDEEIKQAYFAMVKRFDPESHTERFMVIQQAYEKLRDPKRRASIDLFTYNYVRGEFHFTEAEREGPGQGELVEGLRKALAQVEEGGEAANGARGTAVTLLLTSAYQKFRKKQWREAIQDLMQALDIDPTNQRAKSNLNLARMRLGWSYATNNLLAEAITEWEASLKMNADNLPVIHNLAIATEANGDREKAERYWGEALRQWKAQLDESPDDDYVKAIIIETHKHFGGRNLESRGEDHGASAISEYQEVLKISPDDFDAQMKIAETLIEEKKWDEAIAELRRMAQTNPTNIQVLDLYAVALLNGGEVDLAFTTWEKCRKLDPKNYSIQESIIKARYALGRKYRETGQFTPALVNFKAILKMNPKSPEVHKEIAKTYLGKGDKRSAMKHLTVGMKLDPRDKEFKRLISDLKMGR